MEPINRESRTSVHFQLGLVIACPWTTESARTVELQKAMLDQGLEFGQTNTRPGSFVLTRGEPSHLQVKFETPGPQLTGIQILANNPSYDADLFCRDGSAVLSAYRQIFPVDHLLIIQATARIHHLYSSQAHAFQYLWETRLNQSGQDFRCLGNRPVAGGGLRLLIPPHAIGTEEPRSIEIRIESFLLEQRKLLVDTLFVWPKPRPINAGQAIEPESYLQPVEQFASNEVWTFLTQPRPGETPA